MVSVTPQRIHDKLDLQKIVKFQINWKFICSSRTRQTFRISKSFQESEETHEARTELLSKEGIIYSKNGLIEIYGGT